MGTKERKRRSVADISRLSAQTRLTAWTVFMELTRSGMDSVTALRNALQKACPAKDDPYYRSFHSNKMRELELWQKCGLWPLSKPKDIEHDTGPHDTVEVATEVLDRVLQNAGASSSFTLLLDTDDRDAEDHVDTLEFDPIEVAKIIESYEQEPALFGALCQDVNEKSAQSHKTHALREDSCQARPIPLTTDLSRCQPSTSIMETEEDRIIWDLPEVPQPNMVQSETDLRERGRDGACHWPSQEGMDRTTLNELETMLAWWKQNKDTLSCAGNPVVPRPDFAHGQLVRKRITMNAALWEDAEKAAQEQRDISGGTLSGLLEYLLWTHLGSSKKHLKS